MNIPQLKRMLWIMNEIVEASAYGGITRDDMNKKWMNSSKNDYDGDPITERTFYRIKGNLEELFDCNIVCSPVTKKYSVNINDSGHDCNNLTLLEILLRKVNRTSVNQILQMLIAGNDVPADDMRAVRDLTAAVSRLPQTYSEDFLMRAHNIKGADKAEPDEYYRNYICVWNDSIYHLTRQWLSIGFYDNEVCFYLVSNEEDSAERSRKAAEAGFGEGVRYRGGYYWHEPIEPTLFSMPFENKPDMDKVIRRAELLIRRLEKVQSSEKKNP